MSPHKKRCDICGFRIFAGTLCDRCIITRLQAEIKAKDKTIKNLVEAHRRDTRRWQKALKEQGFKVGPFVDGPDIRD